MPSGGYSLRRKCFVCDGKGVLPRNYNPGFEAPTLEIRKTPKMCPCCGGIGETDRLAARDLYGSHIGQLCFIVGCGPSIEKAEKYLQKSRPDHVFCIALNDAIQRVPADYWLWIDGAAYQKNAGCDNARAARRLGVDYFSGIYDPDVYVWERALKLPEDVRKLKVLHRATSLVAALNMACLLGAVRVVTIGCDHKVTDEYLEAKRKEIEEANPQMKGKPLADLRGLYDYTFKRIEQALSEMILWKPDWVSFADASGGDLPLPKTWVNIELQMVKEAWSRIEDGKAVMELGNAVSS